MINNGFRTEWSPIQSVIRQVINKIRLPCLGSLICLMNHKYDYKTNWMTQSSVTNNVINHTTITKFVTSVFGESDLSNESQVWLQNELDDTKFCYQ